MNSYDIKLRKKTIEYLKKGHTYRETGKVFGISPNTLTAWVKKLKETGSLHDKKATVTTRKIDQRRLEEYLLEYPDAYQSEIAEYFGCRQSSVSGYLSRHGYTRKKRLSDIKSKILKK